MNNLTKEQVSLCTVIAAAVMLVSFFFFNAISVSMMGFSYGVTMSSMLFNGLTNFLGVIACLIALLVPIYLILYAYKDNQALASLKPIFKISRKVAAILALAAALLVLISVLANSANAGLGLWLYLIAAAFVCYLGFAVKEA